jgi:class 3 adenylate cyclase
MLRQQLIFTKYVGIVGSDVAHFGVFGGAVRQSCSLVLECQGDQILISQVTRDLLPATFLTQAADPTVFKSK